MALNVIGIDGMLFPDATPDIMNACTKICELQRYAQKAEGDTNIYMRDIDDIKRRFIMLESVYEMPCPPDGFKKLSELFRCDFILGVGLDRAKRMAKGHANTVMTLTAKGILSEHLWISFVLDMFVPSYETLEILANKLLDWSVQYGWINYIDLEEYQAKDLHAWCEAKGFQAELSHGIIQTPW